MEVDAMNGYNTKPTAAILISLLLIFGLFAGCSQNSAVNIDSYKNTAGHTSELFDDEHFLIEIAPEMIPLAGEPAMFDMPMPAASGIDVAENEKTVIDYSNTADGYVMIRYMQSTDKLLKVIIAGPDGEAYTYSLKQNGDYDVFPLSDGSGSYTITVYENIEGIRYTTANRVTVDVKLSDEFAPFLRPNKYVDYNPGSAVVEKAAELIGGKEDTLQKISIIYHYIRANLTYDYEWHLSATLRSGYIPDLDAVLSSGKGICFDYAALMAAMLRSQGVPTKLVFGYNGEIYHAWISTFSDSEGWIENVTHFDGESWTLMDPTFSPERSKNNIYVEKYLY